MTRPPVLMRLGRGSTGNRRPIRRWLPTGEGTEGRRPAPVEDVELSVLLRAPRSTEGIDAWSRAVVAAGGRTLAAAVVSEALGALETLWRRVQPDDDLLERTRAAVAHVSAAHDEATRTALRALSKTAHRAAATAARQLGRRDGWSAAHFAASAAAAAAELVAAPERQAALAGKLVDALQAAASALDAAGLDSMLVLREASLRLAARRLRPGSMRSWPTPRVGSI